jgi:hypothetical protein
MNDDLGAFLDQQVYPALFRQLDSAFPEYGFKRSGGNWQGMFTAALRDFGALLAS